MKKIFCVLLCLICALSAIKMQAWGTTGHRVIAEIAERNLTEKSKAEVKRLLDNQYMAYWANWADFIKSDTSDKWKHTHVWHFVNAPANLNKAEYIEAIKNVKQENLYSEIPKLADVLKSKTSSDEDKKEALIFLIHLMGDMHQPMHTGREEDLGGNTIKIQWFWQDTNLHTLWDSKLVDHEKYSYTEYATVLGVLTEEQKQLMQEGNLEDWFYDSHLLANMLYGMTKEGDNLSYDYNYRVRPYVDGQLQKAGLRLAKFLNNLFDA